MLVFIHVILVYICVMLVCIHVILVYICVMLVYIHVILVYNSVLLVCIHVILVYIYMMLVCIHVILVYIHVILVYIYVMPVCTQVILVYICVMPVCIHEILVYIYVMLVCIYEILVYIFVMFVCALTRPAPVLGRLSPDCHLQGPQILEDAAGPAPTKWEGWIEKQHFNSPKKIHIGAVAPYWMVWIGHGCSPRECAGLCREAHLNLVTNVPASGQLCPGWQSHVLPAPDIGATRALSLC